MLRVVSVAVRIPNRRNRGSGRTAKGYATEAVVRSVTVVARRTVIPRRAVGTTAGLTVATTMRGLIAAAGIDTKIAARVPTNSLIADSIPAGIATATVRAVARRSVIVNTTVLHGSTPEYA